MTPDLTLCRISGLPAMVSNDGTMNCDNYELHDCDPVPMVWSADSHALLEVVECGAQHDIRYSGSGGCPADPPCDLGWRYAAEVKPVRRGRCGHEVWGNYGGTCERPKGHEGRHIHDQMVMSPEVRAEWEAIREPKVAVVPLKRLWELALEEDDL